MENNARALVAFRSSRHWSPKKLAYYLDVSVGQLYRWEHQQEAIPQDVLDMLQETKPKRPSKSRQLLLPLSWGLA